MKDKNIYSSSAFMLLLRRDYNLDILKLASITNLSIKDIYEIREGRKELGKDAYIEIQMEYPDIPQCSYDGVYIPDGLTISI